MPRYIAFLRAINVGGHVVKMGDLRALFESLKFRNVETFIASGNVIFETGAKPVAKLQSSIESALQKALGYEVVTFLRTDSEVAAIAQSQPFPQPAVDSAATFCVGFLQAPLDPEAERKFLAFNSTDEKFQVHGTEIYWISRKKQSESAFSNALFEKTVGVRSTFRGISTIQKLAAKYKSAA